LHGREVGNAVVVERERAPVDEALAREHRKLRVGDLAQGAGEEDGTGEKEDERAHDRITIDMNEPQLRRPSLQGITRQIPNLHARIPQRKQASMLSDRVCDLKYG
jgi:hypothetical protein